MPSFVDREQPVGFTGDDERRVGDSELQRRPNLAGGRGEYEEKDEKPLDNWDCWAKFRRIRYSFQGRAGGPAREIAIHSVYTARPARSEIGAEANSGLFGEAWEEELVTTKSRGRRPLLRSKNSVVADADSPEGELAWRAARATACLSNPASVDWLIGCLPRCRAPPSAA